MKQFTFSAQVANNLLTVLQGYSKTIRLLLVMFLTLCVSAEVWGQTKTDIMFAKGFGSYTTNSFSAAGTDRTAVANSTNATSVKYAMQVFNGNTGAVRGNQSSAASNFSCRNTTTYDGYYISQVSLTVSGGTIDGSTNGRSVVYFGTTAYGNPNTTTPSGTATKASPASSGQTTLTWTNTNEDVSYFILYNLKTSGTALSANATTSLKVVWTKKTASAPSHTITAKSNNNSYGTVSVSGTTITATPNDGYRVSTTTPYTISPSGSATVTQNGNTFTVTPSADTEITINFEAIIPQYTVTWDVNGDQSVTTQVTEGSKPTFPATPSSCDATSNTFYGWATATWDGKINDVSAKTIYTSANDMPAVNGAVTYYAVFAEATTTGGGGGSTTELFSEDFSSITSGNSTSTSGSGSTWTKNSNFYSVSNAYQAGGAVRLGKSGEAGNLVTKQLTAAIGETLTISFKVKGWSTVEGDIQVSGNNSEFTQPSAIEYSPTMSGSFVTKTVSVVLTKANPYIKIATTAKRAFIDDIVITKTTSGGGGSTTYDNYITTCAAGDPCEQLGAATGLTVETDFVQDGQTYVKFSWTPADNTKTNATSQKICFGKVDEAGTCVDNLAKNQTWTGDLKSKLDPGEYWWSIQALGDGVNYCDGDVVNGTNFTIEAPKASITLSELGVTTTDNTTYYVGAQYTLPTTSSQSCDGKQLVGWSTVEVAETDTKPTENYYELGEEVTLAATQTFYAVFAAGSGGGGETPVDLSISDYATKNNWVNETQYATISIDENITATVTGSNNTGKYYTNGEDWRLYQTESPTLTFTAKDGCTIKQITIAYTIKNTGTLTFGGSNISSGTACEINATSAVFGVGNTSSETNGQVRITQISVMYSGGGGYTAYSTSCIPTYSITYDFADGDGEHCTDTRVEGGSDYTICEDVPTKTGYTFLHWSDGVNTYNPSDVIATVTTDITLTAVWQINTYTVIWSNNGATTEESYEHGETLNVPDPNDIPSCDGEKEFVGWTEQSGYYHATTAPTDLFKTTTATVTADKTYYAVFATKGAGGIEFVLGESGTFKMYANVNGTNYYAQGGVSSSQITSTTNALSASDYTLTYADGVYTIKQGTSDIGHGSGTSLSSTSSTWTISEGTNGSWRVQSKKDESRALSYSSSANAFKAYATSNITAGDDTYFDIEFGTGSSGYSDYTTTCQQVESIEVQNPQTEFYLTDDFTIGSGKVIATLSGGGTIDVTGDAHFSGYNMEATGTQIVTVTYMGATATYEITVKPLDNAWVLTWNVSGKTNTGLGPRSVTKGSAIGTLPTPEVPAACAGKTFMGWTESNIVPSDGKGIVYITEATVPSKNTTYYAVFATINNFSTQAAIEDIESGSKVVIVAVASMDASGGAGQAISSRTISITSQGVIGLSGDEVSIFDETINTPHSTCIWTLTKEGGGIVFEQGEKYIRAVNNGYRRLLLETTKDYWTLSPVDGKDKTYHMQSGNTSHYVEWFDHTDSKYDEGERYIGFVPYTEANDNGDFDMQFYVTANKDGDADITDYTTGCAEYTITYYGFHGGYSTSCSSDGTIVLPVNSIHTIPDCEGLVINDHTDLGREFLNVWMTQPHGGHTFKPGDTFILTQDTTLYAQWKMETTSDVTTLPTDIEDLAGTDIYVYGGTTLNIQPGTTTINSLTLKGGLQADGSYKMPTVWVPEGATLVRNSNKIYLDLVVNAETWYPFAVPFETKNTSDIHYLHPDMRDAATYGQHFDIKTYDGARRADVGEDKANNWVRLKRHTTAEPVSFKPGVGYIISAMAYPGKDTATIRIPMSVPNTWFKNGEQAEVGTTVRNTIAVTAHAGDAATEHQRHAGWNFVANPYLTSFAGGNVANDGGLDYINGELIIQGSYEYTDEEVPYVTVPAYDFAYYSQHKLSDVKLSPEWSFFVQVGTGGTMNFTTAGRQQAPASIAARNAEERPVKMDVDLILSDNHSSDQTGIIISDRYTDAYEIGRDLEKLFGSAYNLSVYTLMEDNTPLAFQALAIRSSMQVIPVGYRAPEQGEYTFRLNEATSSIDLLNEQYEQLVLVDYQTGELTNLLYTDYTFYSKRTQSNSRFAIYAVPRQNAPTDLPNAIGSDEEVRKVIYNDHLYILRDGNVYNGMGQKM